MLLYIYRRGFCSLHTSPTLRVRAYSPCRFSVARRPVSPTPQAGQTWSSRMESAPKVAEAKANSGCPPGHASGVPWCSLNKSSHSAALRPCNSSRANASSANCCAFRADSPACRFSSRLDRLLSARLSLQLLSDYSFRSCVASSVRASGLTAGSFTAGGRGPPRSSRVPDVA